MKIKITQTGFTTSGKPAIVVQSPFHPGFPARARQLGGIWSVNHRHWVFDARDEAAVRVLCIEIYGTDGSGPVPTLDIELSLDGLSDTGELWGFGRQLAWRHANWPVRLGDGVRVLRGGFPDVLVGRRAMGLHWAEGTVLLIRDVPASLLDTASPAIRSRLCIHEAEARSEVPRVFRDALPELGGDL